MTKTFLFLPPEQHCLSQASLSELDPRPEQSLPPNCGGGLVHVRDLERVPPPQVTEQELH